MQTTTGRVACVGDRTSLSWNLCLLVDPSRFQGPSFPILEDDRRGCDSDASAVHGYAGRIGQAEVELQTELAQSRQQAANEL